MTGSRPGPTPSPPTQPGTSAAKTPPLGDLVELTLGSPVRIAQSPQRAELGPVPSRKARLPTWPGTPCRTTPARSCCAMSQHRSSGDPLPCSWTRHVPSKTTIPEMPFSLKADPVKGLRLENLSTTRTTSTRDRWRQHKDQPPYPDLPCA
jgi:hypothetical protein